MTHEAGIWIFGIITLICLSVWLLCRRSKAVEDARPLFHPFHYGCLSELIEPKICSYATPKDVGEPETTKPLPKGWQGWEGESVQCLIALWWLLCIYAAILIFQKGQITYYGVTTEIPATS